MRRGRTDLVSCFVRHAGAPVVRGQPADWPDAWRHARVSRPAPPPIAPHPAVIDAAPATFEPCEFQRTEEQARLEAALFLAREPLPTRKLAKLARLTDGTRARALIRDLNTTYDADGSAFRIEWIAGGFQLLSRAPFGPWLRRLLEAAPETRLSAAAAETLAIVAYRQPVTRAETEAIRGVGCDEMLRHLLERELIAIGGRSEELGRPNFYVTTRQFLQIFGLGHIDELPPIALPAGLLDARSDEEGEDQVSAVDDEEGLEADEATDTPANDDGN
jgi:segregation and condensation protein B